MPAEVVGGSLLVVSGASVLMVAVGVSEGSGPTGVSIGSDGNDRSASRNGKLGPSLREV